jgi:hypothetical protein
MQNLGYKQITKETWMKSDRISISFLQVPSDDDVKRGEIYLDAILKPQLNDTIPIEIRKMYEVARGGVVYGYFFYPLYSLACEQLFRVGEAAITSRCKNIDPRLAKRTFEKKIDLLFEQGLLNDLERLRWHALRGLRNISSHPVDQSIFPPGLVIRNLVLLADDINKLFSVEKR